MKPAATTLLSLQAELDSCVAQMQTIVQKVSRDKPVAMQEKVVESSEVSVISMVIAEAFFNRVFSIANEYVLARAKKLDIQKPPLFCVQYTNDSKIRNAEAIQVSERDLNSIQQIFNAANNEDKAALQAILDRKQTDFDAKMAKRYCI